MRKSVRFLVSGFLILFFGFCFFNAKVPALAQTTNQYTAPVNNPDVPQNMHTYSQNLVIEVMSALVCQITGVDAINPNQPCLGVDAETNKIGFADSSSYVESGGGGAIGVVSMLIGQTLKPPVRTSDFIAYAKQNFGVAKNTYASGPAIESLSPLVPLWAGFRNIAYLLMTVIFVFIGVAIMLRVKIDPRTVMSIQNSIPKIIIGILLITFSLAIAGLLIDFMYISIYVVYGLLSNISSVTMGELNPLTMQQDVFGAVGSTSAGLHLGHAMADLLLPTVQTLLGLPPCGADRCLAGVFNPFEIVLPVSVFSSGSYEGGLAKALIDSISLIAGIWGYSLIAQIDVPGFMGSDLGGIVENAPFSLPVAYLVKAFVNFFLRVGLPWLIIFFVIAIAIFATLVRLWFKLVITYVSIVISIILSPFWLLSGMIPGGKGFSTWFRGLAANIIVFPTVMVMFLLGEILVNSIESGNGMFVPPLIGNYVDPEFAKGIIGLGIILLTPNAADMVQKAVKAPKFDISPITQGVQAGASPVIGAGKGAWSRLTRRRDLNRGIETDAPLRNLWTGIKETPRRFTRSRFGIPDGATGSSTTGSPPAGSKPKPSLQEYLRKSRERREAKKEKRNPTDSPTSS